MNILSILEWITTEGLGWVIATYTVLSLIFQAARLYTVRTATTKDDEFLDRVEEKVENAKEFLERTFNVQFEQLVQSNEQLMVYTEQELRQLKEDMKVSRDAQMAELQEMKAALPKKRTPRSSTSKSKATTSTSTKKD